MGIIDWIMAGDTICYFSEGIETWERKYVEEQLLAEWEGWA